MRFLPFLLLVMLVLVLANASEAQAAPPAWQASSAIAASTGADVTVTLPAHVATDILLLQVMVRDVDDTITWPAGWAQIATVDRGTTARYWWAWKRAASNAETNPLVNKNTATGDTYAAVTTYRGAITTGDPWEVIGTPNTSTTAGHVLNGITTLTAESLIVAALCGENNSAASGTTFNATNPASLPQVLYVESGTGANGACTAGAAARTAIGATGSVTATWTNTVVGSGGIVLALKPVPPAPPSVTSSAATALTTTGATLNGTVSSNGAITTVTFEYGPTIAYGSTATAAQSPLAAGATNSTVSAAITGLTCGTLYHFRAKGVNSAGTTNGGDLSFTTLACPLPPEVLSINRSGFDPTSANTSVTWTVIFDSSVIGVDTADFALVQAGGVSGASISSVTGGGTTWTVTANTGTGTTGTLRLDLIDNDTILSSGVALGGTGLGNGNFSGQSYTVAPPFCSTVPSAIFCDDFERSSPGSVGNGWTVTPANVTNCTGAAGNTGCAGIDRDIPPFSIYSNPHADTTRSMFTRWNIVSVDSPVIDLSTAPAALLSFWMRRGSDTFSECPEASGENYLVQYWDGAAWQILAQYPSSPSAALCGTGEVFTPVIQLPPGAFHSGFKLRFYQPSGSGKSGSGGAPGVVGYDYWHMDDVVITPAPASSYSGAFCDNFEGGLGRWSITAEGFPGATSIGDARIGTTDFLSAGHELDMRWGYVAASTLRTDMTGVTGNIDYWVKSGGGTTNRAPDAGENLVVEYFNSAGTWTQLAQYLANGSTTSTIYNGSHVLPADAKHPGFRLRFRQLAGSGYDMDYWHVDDVCVGTIIPTADLALTKTRGAAPLVPGSNVSYTLNASNNGPGTLAGSLEIVDTLPASLSLISASGSGWSCSASGQVVTCSWVGTLASGASAPSVTITASLSPSATGLITNTATLSGSVIDNNLANNTATDTGSVVAAILLAEYHLEEASWNGTSGEVKDTAGAAGGPFDGSALASSSPLPTPALASPALAGSPGTCGYATLPGPTANGGTFTIPGLPVSTTPGAKTSVAFWMYWDGTDNAMPIGWYQHDLWLRGGSFGFNTANSDIYGISSAGLANGWHHVVAVFTNGSVTSNLLFIDGVSQTLTQRQGTPNLAAATVGSTLRVGGWMWDTGYRFSGRMDEVLVYKNVLSQSEVTALYSASHACAAAVDHYELSLPSSSISCLATTATVTACANSTSPCTSASTLVNGQTATLAANGGSLGSSAVTFNAAGVASTTLSYPAAADGTTVSVTLSGEQVTALYPRKCCPDGTSCVVANSCSTTFNTVGFIFSSAANSVTAPPIPTPQVAGTSGGTYYLRAVKTLDNSNHTCGAAFSGAQKVDFAYECNNPATCYSSDLLSVNAGAATTIAGNKNGGLLGFYSYTPVDMTFDASGNAPFTFIYSDAGQITLKAKKALTADSTKTPPIAAATLTGNSNAFVVKPAGFVLSDIKQTAAPNLANPAAANASGTKFVKAGEAFSVTVTAVTSTGTTAYNYGKETSPEGVKLTSALANDGNVPETHFGMTNNPTLTNNTVFGTFTNGVATGTTFSWDEVGIITLVPSVGDGNYLGALDTQCDSALPSYGGAIACPPSGNVGRFYAAKFGLSANAITNRADLCPAAANCPAAFTYMGEPMNALFTLTAQAVGGATLQNYSYSATAANNFAKLDPLAAVAVGTDGPLKMGVVNSATTRTPFPPCGGTPVHPCFTPAQATAGSFLSGVANVTLPFTLFRDAASPSGPYAALEIGIAPQDSDGAIMAVYDLDTVNVVAGTNNHSKVGQTETRFGRILVPNAYGSELLRLPIGVLVQYWNGSRWVTSATDSLTQFDTNKTTAIPVAGNLAVSISKGPLTVANVNVVSPGVTKFTNGAMTFKLEVPGATQSGSADLSITAPSYLPSTTGRATFGIYKSRFIYLREMY